MTPQSLVEAVREAAAAGAPLRIAGRGRWLQAGRPVQAGRTVSLAQHSGIVHYEPGDFTLTARAGTSLGELADVTAAHRQFAAFDPYGAPDGTLGATVATASSGPWAQMFGGPRDNVIGLEVVTGDGAIVRCGGRVVKNVAGFDLTRLFTGSWGTLGIITEVSVRLRALPSVDETLAIALDEQPAALTGLLATLRAASIAPLALEMVSPALSARLALGSATTLLVRIAGNSTSVRAQRQALSRLGHPRAVDRAVWETLRAVEPPDAIVARVSSRPSVIGSVWHAVREATAGTEDVLLAASLGRGVVRCVLPGVAEESARRLAAREGLVVIFERLPGLLWRELAPSAVTDRLSRGIKARFDPSRVLNPGLLGENES